MRIHGHDVHGVAVDPQTRCGHYHSDIDIIAIKFPCCNTYYPCYECHEAVAGHDPQVWRRDQHDEKAVLCGHCGAELTVAQYLRCEATCPDCHARFNPGCSLHYHLYFEV